MRAAKEISQTNSERPSLGSQIEQVFITPSYALTIRHTHHPRSRRYGGQFVAIALSRLLFCLFRMNHFPIEPPWQAIREWIPDDDTEPSFDYSTSARNPASWSRPPRRRLHTRSRRRLRLRSAPSQKDPLPERMHGKAERTDIVRKNSMNKFISLRAQISRRFSSWNRAELPIRPSSFRIQPSFTRRPTCPLAP